MDVKIVKKEYFEIEGDELNRIIKSHFGIDKFEVVAEGELNSSHYTFDNSGYPIDGHDYEDEVKVTKELIDRVYVKKTPHNYEYVSICSFFDVLVHDGVLPKGNYLLDCTW